MDHAGQSHGGRQSEYSQRGALAYLDGDPVTLWEAQALLNHLYRGSGGGAVPFTVGQSRASNLWGHQIQLSDTLSWSRGKHTCASAEV